jgi:hypothetical protein
MGTNINLVLTLITETGVITEILRIEYLNYFIIIPEITIITIYFLSPL